MRRAAVVAAALLVVVAGGGAPHPRSARAADDRVAAIQGVLDRRAEGIRSRDRSAFRSTLADPSDAFGQRQQELFDNLGGLPLARYAMEVRDDAMGELTRPTDHDRYPSADDVAIFPVRERYRLRGFDRQDVFQDHYLTFVRIAEGWRIAADTDLEDVGLLSARNVWDLTPIRVDRSERFLAVGPACAVGAPCPDPAVTGTLAAAEAAVQRVDDLWSRPWHQRVPILIPRSSEDLTRIIEATYPVDSFIAFAFWTGGEGANPGSRIVVNPGRFAGASIRAIDVLVHELAHIAMLPRSGAFTPRFLDEGIAEWIRHGGAGSGVSTAHAVARSDPTIPEDWRFLVGDGAAIFRMYQRSLSLVDHIADRWGRTALERLYVRLGTAGDQPGTARFHLDRTFRRVLGVDIAELTRGWASSIGSL